jgi:hypothetical protein
MLAPRLKYSRTFLKSAENVVTLPRGDARGEDVEESKRHV